MKNSTFVSKNQFTDKSVAILTTVSVLLSIFIPLSSVKAAGEWYDTGWIYASNSIFQADEFFGDQCVPAYKVALIWNGTDDRDAFINFNAPAGDYKIDMQLVYSHRPDVPPQTDETMTVYSGENLSLANIPPVTYTDKENVPDYGDSAIPAETECADGFNAITTYINVTNRTLNFPANGDLAIEGTGSSLAIYAVRIYGYKKETGTPNLLISKSVDKSSVSPGDEVVYTLNYTNIGNAAATGVIVRDTFNYVNQQYLTFVSALPSPSSGTDTWNIGTLNPGQSGQISIRAKVGASVPVGTTEIKNRGSIQSNETSLQYSNCANFFVTRTGNATLTITKSVNKTYASPGDEIVYTLNYQNTGQGSASNVVITDQFVNLNQTYLTFLSATPVPSSGTDTWNIGTFNPGQSGQIVIRARISTSIPGGSTEIKNRGSIQSNETSLQYSNYVSTYVSGNAFLAIDKLGRNLIDSTSLAKSTPAKPSQRVEFSIIVRSTGNVDATNVMVNDTLPSKLIFVPGSTKVDGVSVADGIIDSGINIGTIVTGQSKTVTFEVNVADENHFTIGQETLLNIVHTWININNKVLGSAMVVVTKDLPKVPVLAITKSVDKTSASGGDEIVYTLNYQNTGQGSASNVVITDQFVNLNQTYLTFLSATPVPSSGTDTWNIGTFNPGQSGQIVIRARISTSIPGGSTEIKNRASTDSNETTLQYSNYVSTFVSANTALNIVKTVRNITGGGSFSDSIEIRPGDEVEFSLAINSTGNTLASNVKVWDSLPNRLNYVSGSTTVDGVYHGDGIVLGGIYIGDLNPQQTKTVKFRATASGDTLFNIGVTTLTNYGYTSANGIATVFDTAAVNVKKDSGCSPSLQINKQIRNITQGSAYWTDTLSAKPGDEVEVLIRITSVGNEPANNSKLRDQLPANWNYVSGTTTVDGAYRGDGITSSDGITLGDLYVGAFREVKFRTKLSSDIGSGSTTLTNYAYAWADATCGQISDSAQLIVNTSGGGSQNYGLALNKFGHNVSRGQTDWLESFLASPSEEVEFSIQLTNVGDANLTNVRVWDTLPNNISLIGGTITIDGVTWSGDITGSGLSLGALNAGQTKSIRFHARLASEGNFGAGTITMVNTAYATADNISQVSDQTSVIIYRPGQVLGAATSVKTGVGSMSLIFLMLISGIVAFFLYCRVREEKLLEILNSNKGNRVYRWVIKSYFKMKFLFTVKMIRFKKVYW